MRCPNCSHDMSEVRYETEMIDQCSHCGGTWLDDKEVKGIVDSTQTKFDEREKVSAIVMKGSDHRESGTTLICPKCSLPLETMQYAVSSGVFVDRCPQNHGLFFDMGELVKMQIIVEQDQLHQGIHDEQKRARSLGEKVCPRDGTSLTEISYETERLDTCSKCGGVWCDDQELKAVIDSREVLFTSKDFQDIQAKEGSGQTSKQEDLVIDLACLSCGKPMRRANYSYNSGIIIDRCIDGHGIWLDHHELERIQVFAERWSQQADLSKKKYGNLLIHARTHTEESFEKAIQEGKDLGNQASVIGRFLNKTERKGN